MKKMFARMMKEDDGVLSFEWILLLTLLVIGIVSGVSAARDAIIDEFGDVAQAIGRALADAAFRPVPARKAASGRKPAPRKAASKRLAKKLPKKPSGKVKAGKGAKAPSPRRKPATKAAPRKAARRPQKGRKAARSRRLTKRG